MTYQLVAIDLDGTLLDNHHQIPAENARAVRACIARGVRVVIASGRSFAAIVRYCRELGLTGPHISLNGGAVTDVSGDVLDTVPPLTDAQIAPVVAALDERQIDTVIFATDGLYVRPNTPRAAEIVGYGEPQPLVVPELSSRYIAHPVKVLGFHERGDGVVEAGLRAAFEGPLAVIRTGPPFLEFMRPGVSKGAALAGLLRRWEIPPAAALAIGDSYNDISMFDVVGFGVAMGGAVEALRRKSSAVTGGNEESGVAQALDRYVLDAA